MIHFLETLLVLNPLRDLWGVTLGFLILVVVALTKNLSGNLLRGRLVDTRPYPLGLTLVNRLSRLLLVPRSLLLWVNVLVWVNKPRKVASVLRV